MYPIPLSMIRYLIVMRVTRDLVWIPNPLSVELSLVLGHRIADRLPSTQAGPWRKALAPWEAMGGLSLLRDKKLKDPPELSWPMEAVLFGYPGKRTFGRGERILVEIKLIGKSAEHNTFIEHILPALEEVGIHKDPAWQPVNSLWGGFDIASVYVARGTVWEPLVQEGALNLDRTVTPYQWAEGLRFYEPDVDLLPDTLNWLTPFDLDGRPPTLSHILDALVFRINQLIAGKTDNFDRLLRYLGAEEQAALNQILEQAERIQIYENALVETPRNHAGRWWGKQRFTACLPNTILPYLGLASIFHVGRYSHFGCGTFFLYRHK